MVESFFLSARSSTMVADASSDQKKATPIRRTLRFFSVVMVPTSLKLPCLWSWSIKLGSSITLISRNATSFLNTKFLSFLIGHKNDKDGSDGRILPC